MQALIDRANQVGHYLPQDQNQNWEYKLFSPLKEQHLSHEQSTENDSTYSFKYMTWVRKQNIINNEETQDNNIINITDNNNNNEDQDTLIPLDLTQFDRSKYTTNNNGLSADDIRGAVGGSESIPGLSSSSDPQTNNNNTQNEEKITRITETPIVEAPAPIVEEVTRIVENPSIEETPGVVDSTITQSPIVETPLSETPAIETPVTEEVPVIEPVETATEVTTETPVESNAVDTPTEETSSAQPATQDSTVKPVPESEDIEMKD